MTMLPANAGTAMAAKRRCCDKRAVVPFALAAVLAGLGLASCEPNPDTDLSARIESVLLARQHPTPTVDQIVGGFDISLELGDDAPGPVDVAPANGTFTLVRESDQKAMTKLAIDSLTTRHLEAGQRASVHVTVAQQGVGQSLPTAVLDEICKSKPLRIDGTIADSPDGGLNTPVQSGSFDLLNCP
jgi:hypothetical protein